MPGARNGKLWEGIRRTIQRCKRPIAAPSSMTNLTGTAALLQTAELVKLGLAVLKETGT